MNILQSKLLHLPVYTRSGRAVGRIIDWSVDIQTHMAVEYTVRPFPYIPLVSIDRVIPRASVIEITADRMIVDDGMVSVAEGVRPTPVAPTSS